MVSHRALTSSSSSFDLTNYLRHSRDDMREQSFCEPDRVIIDHHKTPEVKVFVSFVGSSSSEVVSNYSDSYLGCWHSGEESHTKDCSYELIRIEVIHDLSDSSLVASEMGSERKWGPQTVRHIFAFKETLERVEEK